MSDSRNFPFSFSQEVQEILGPPSRLNEEARAAYPTLFNLFSKGRLTYVNDDRLGPSVMTSWRLQPPIQAGTGGTPVGIFFCHVALEWHCRDTNTLPLPPFMAHRISTRMSVHASALVGRLPSSIHCSRPVQPPLHSLHGTYAPGRVVD